MTPAELQKLSEQNERRSQCWRTDVQTSVIAGQREGWNAALEYVHRVRQGQSGPIALLMLSMSGNDRPDPAELELLRWGPGGREHFGDVRPGDYPRTPETSLRLAGCASQTVARRVIAPPEGAGGAAA